MSVEQSRAAQERNAEVAASAPLDVSIIIVSWNVADLLEGCIRSIVEHSSGLSLEVIVVDNASKDHSLSMLAEPYRKLASERVKIELPPVRDSNLSWDLPTDDIEHLVRLLRDADVVINMASTLSIDTAVLDRPVIAIAFDPSGELPYDHSVRRFYDYTHMAHVVRAGAVQLAKSAEDLRKNIMSYLKHPEQDREGRRRIVQQQFGRVDGRSAMRVVEEVLALVLKNNRVQT